MKFRDLTPDEIECRIGMVRANGISLLLYKDARCDMNILDETVGEMNWQREHKEFKGNLFCGISIWDDDKKQWVTKFDCGTESNTEKEKGEASDSFKRAGFNWGIGRELYTSPFIWIGTNVCTIKEGKCNDRFEVVHIKIENKQITELKIVNTNTGVECFKWKLDRSNKIKYIEDNVISKTDAERLLATMRAKSLSDITIKDTLQRGYGVDTVYELTGSQYAEILRKLKD
jgi:hypothetical protein